MEQLVAELKRLHPTPYLVESKEKARWGDYNHGTSRCSGTPVALYTTRERAQDELNKWNYGGNDMYHVVPSKAEKWGSPCWRNLDDPLMELRTDVFSN